MDSKIANPVHAKTDIRGQSLAAPALQRGMVHLDEAGRFLFRIVPIKSEAVLDRNRFPYFVVLIKHDAPLDTL